MQNRTSKGKNWILAFLLVALISALAYFVARGIVNRNSSSLGSAVATPALASQPVSALGRGMLYYDGGSLHALNERGQQIWSYAAGVNVGFSVDSGGVSVWTDRLLSLLTPDKGLTLFSGNMDDAVRSARLGALYAAVQIGTEHDSSIVIMETGGRQVESIALPNQTVLDFGFFNNDSLLWVMSLDTEGTVPSCSISTYRPGKMLAGTIRDTQQVLYEVVFQSSKIRAVGVNHIKDFDYTGKEIESNRMLVYGWYLMGIDEASLNPLMAFVPVSQAETAGSIYDLRMIRGQEDQSVRLPFAAMRVLARDDGVYAFSSQYVALARMGESSPVSYTLPLYVDSVIDLTENHTAIVSSGGGVYMVPLP